MLQAVTATGEQPAPDATGEQAALDTTGATAAAPTNEATAAEAPIISDAELLDPSFSMEEAVKKVRHSCRLMPTKKCMMHNVLPAYLA